MAEKVVQTDREKALDLATKQIERQFGQGAIMKLGDSPRRITTGVISTGSLGLDIALGVGGIPRGRVTEVYGPEASGKTTLALHIVAEAQKAGGPAAIIDAEHAIDPEYAANLGVNINDLLISQPDTGEQALAIADTLVRSSAVDVVVIDSVAALVPKAELEGEMGDAHVGLQARLMSQALRKLTAIIAKSRTAFVFINQIREKIGVLFGNPETTTGGRALKFYSTVRIEVRRRDSLKEGTDIIGNRTLAKVVKNKVAPPFRRAVFDIIFGKGISKTGEILDLGVDLGLAAKSGSWYSYGNTKLGQGRESSKLFLESNPDICDELESKIRESSGLTADLEPAPEGNGGEDEVETEDTS
jgi:recombination protein RecA